MDLKCVEPNNAARGDGVWSIEECSRTLIVIMASWWAKPRRVGAIRPSLEPNTYRNMADVIGPTLARIRMVLIENGNLGAPPPRPGGDDHQTKLLKHRRPRGRVSDTESVG